MQPPPETEFKSTWRKRLSQVPSETCTGSVLGVEGLKIRAAMVQAAVGDIVSITGRKGPIRGQILGIAHGQVIISSLDPLAGLLAGAPVTLVNQGAGMVLGEHLLGTVLNGLGEIIGSDGAELSEISSVVAEFFPRRRQLVVAGIHNEAPAALRRRAIDSQLMTGIRAIDAFVPIGYGQRLCVMAEPGVGKSTLFSMIAGNSSADVTVIALIGERGREVNEFLFHTLDANARSRTVAVVSTGDEPALRRVFAAHTATRIAEYFRSQGKRVLLLMDSLTRLCRAYREVGLAAGEPPVRRGYPPSVFADLPKLIERTGCDERGSITALYTVLLSADLEEDPMVDEVKGITDGHLLLRASLAERGHYPAIDVVSSISRLSSKLIAPSVSKDVALLRKLLARLQQDRELALLSDRIDPELECALSMEGELVSFLRQDCSKPEGESEIAEQLQRLAARARADLAVEK